MKKTLSINISGLIFNIDEDAYLRLNQYTESIRNHFGSTEGNQDIISDIESRIAELLQPKITEQKQVICIADVEEVIAALGQPSEMDESESEAEKQEEKKKSNHRKRLFRDPDNKKLGGVAAGIGQYFSLDPLWVRLVFVILFLTSGVGFFVYIALWIFIPEAVTTADKLEMRGEPVNVATIEQSIKKEYESVKGTFNEYANEAREGLNRTGKKAGQTAGRLNDPVMQIIRGIARFFGILFGLLFLTIGLALTLVAGSLFLGWNDFDIWSDAELPFAGGEQLWELLFSSPLSASIAPLAIGVLVAVPLIMLVYAGLRLIAGETFKIPGLGNIATGLWIASVIGLFYVGMTLLVDVKEQHFFEGQKKKLVSPQEKTFYLMALDDGVKNGTEITAFDEQFFLRNGKLFGTPRVYFDCEKNGSGFVEIERRARGKNREMSRERAEGIIFDYQLSDTSLVISPCFGFGTDNKLRQQKIWVNISLPEGKIVSIPKNLKQVFSGSLRYEIEERAGAENLWIMTNEGLKPYPIE